MGRGGAIYLSYTATVLLATASSASAGLWDVDIDLGAAPSPQDGPLFSAHATRNRALLPYQIFGIVGAYLGTVLIASTLLFTIGRKLRKRAQAMSERPVEMVKPMYKAFDPSPVSPRSFSRWGQKLRSKNSRSGSIRSARSGTSEIGSPAVESVASFDPETIKNHQRELEDQLADIYGSVYDFEEQRGQQDMTQTGLQRASPPQYSRTKPPPLAVSRPDLQRVQTSDPFPQSPYSPMTSRSPGVRAIYPPIPENEHDVNRDLYQAHTQADQREATAGRESSFESSKATELRSSPELGKSRKGILRKSIKDIKISAPIQRLRDDDNSDGARTPLSPRFYTNPGPPPPLPTIRTSDSSFPSPDPGTAASATFSEMQDYDNEQIDEIRSLPQTHPQRTNKSPYDEQDARLGTVMTASPNKRSVANVNNPLPFRQNNYTQQRNAFPKSPAGNWNFHIPRSPGPMSPPMKSPSIRERVLEVGNQRLGAPFTGCATPYSPYMPYTPVTPITPHLQTRAERKQRQKEERATRGAITEEDQVADDKDIWASAY